MNGWTTTCVGIAATLAGGAATQDALVRTAEAERVEVGATVSIRQSDPGWFVFIVYSGPYWKAGTEFKRVRSYFDEHGITRPIFARYRSSPMSPSETAPHVEIGSFVDDAHEPRPPFEKTWRNVETAACMIIEGRAATTRQDYAAIEKWIGRRGYRSAGPVTEVYHYGAMSGGAKGIRTEIRVAIDTSGVRRNIPAPQPSPVSAKVQREQSSTSDSEVENPAPQAVEVPAGTGITAAAKSTIDRAVNELRSVSRNSSAAESSRSSSPVAPPQDRSATLAELVDAGRFDELAGRVLPIDRSISGATRIWLGQIVFRVGAIAKGVDPVSPKDALPITGIGDALRRRYREVAANLDLNPLDHAVVRVDTRNDAHAAEKRAVMSLLDALMSRIALGTSEAVDVKTKIIEVLEQIQELTRSPAARRPDPDRDGLTANPM